MTFQSTHPVRGATKDDAFALVAPPISIHAPREGCDTRTTLLLSSHPPFQSTHPVRGATNETFRLAEDVYISIHAPREGCDETALNDMQSTSISIHAPREGCDIICLGCLFL